MKMPTIVGIFIFISREIFMLSWIEHEKSFITSGPDVINDYSFEHSATGQIEWIVPATPLRIIAVISLGGIVSTSIS